MQLKPLSKLFREHPASVGETYFEHLLQALSFGIRMVLAGLACMLHGIFPFLFIKTGSAQIQTLHGRMITNRSKHPEAFDFVI